MEQPDRCAEPTGAITLDEALSRIRAAVAPIVETESVALKEAAGRILAKDIQAPCDLPPFDNSAMDGYALRHEDVSGGHDTRLAIIGSSFAGRPYPEVVGLGQCVRIFTGAAMPKGADAVVMQEDAIVEGGYIRLTRPVSARSNVRPAGDEIRSGARLLDRGKRLNGADIGLLAEAGRPDVPVVRKLRIAFFSTGDELRAVGEPLDFGQIYDSNRYLLHALLSCPAVEAIDLGAVRDDPCALRETLLDASREADVVISSGGASVGEADHVASVLAGLGRVDFWKVRMKPGKPVAFGRVGAAWFFGLPGNPVAVVVTFRQIVRPALLQMVGAQVPPPLRLRAVSSAAIKKSPGRMEFQRGVFAPDGQRGLTVTPCIGQGSHQLLGMSRANCLIILPADNAGVDPGDSIEIEVLMDDVL